MPWSTAGRNARADATAALITHISLHSADPGASGTNEVTGGGYARQVPSYGTAASGVTDITAPLEFLTPSSQGVTHIGYWASSTWLGGFARTDGDGVANVAGEYEVISAPITANA